MRDNREQYHIVTRVFRLKSADTVADILLCRVHHDPDQRVIVREMKCVEPVGESKSDYAIFSLIAEKLGQGHIGQDALRRAACHPALQGRPFILETPNDDEGYIREIRTVLEWMG